MIQCRPMFGLVLSIKVGNFQDHHYINKGKKSLLIVCISIDSKNILIWYHSEVSHTRLVLTNFYKGYWSDINSTFK